MGFGQLGGSEGRDENCTCSRDDQGSVRLALSQVRLLVRLTDTNRSKVADEESLPKGVDVGNPLVDGQNDRKSTQDEDADHEHNQPPDAECQVRVGKFGEGEDRANVDKGCDVEEQVDDVGEVRLFGLLVEETVPGKGRSASKGREQVVRAKQSRDTWRGSVMACQLDRPSTEEADRNVPIVRMAKLMYWATNDCRSTRFFRSQNFIVFLATNPTMAPITIPSATS